MVKITETSALGAYEKLKLKKEEDFLMVGKSDKSISVVSKGEVIPISQTGAQFTRTGSATGILKIPTNNLAFILQYGAISVAGDSVYEVTFTEPFPNRIFQVITNTNALKSALDFVVAQTNIGFTITTAPATGSGHVISWTATGY